MLAVLQAAMRKVSFLQPTEPEKGTLEKPPDADRPTLVDRLAPARGILLGLALASAFWSAVALAVFAWWR